ncbi:hypothetical protein RIR_jg21680.t1 [Rhizophagus irregularis DAOM 181602=DAOM 197198]|nr:hypothetical protein RIR_jg21680.t1 [Rhizophagus irregularis DAOM 181602=DAOM 197198]
MSNSQSMNKSTKKEAIEEERKFSSTDSNRGYIVANAVKEACRIALEQNRQDWDAACKFILQNKSLTDNERSSIINLLTDNNDNIFICKSDQDRNSTNRKGNKQGQYIGEIRSIINEFSCIFDDNNNMKYNTYGGDD